MIRHYHIEATQEELTIWQANASARGLSLSAFIRMKVNDDQPKPVKQAQPPRLRSKNYFKY